MRRSMTIDHDYFSWLYNIIREPKKRIYYTKLCEIFYDKSFRWFVHNDDNRCEDGLNLRRQFIEEQGLDESHLEVISLMKKPCTIFEVLIALAKRMNDIMYDLNDQRDKTPKWFHTMLLNLGLNVYTDDYNLGDRFPEMTEIKIDDILETLMDRTYDFYGHGGLFPLKSRPRKHQAEVEIWYQLMEYLDENHGG